MDGLLKQIKIVAFASCLLKQIQGLSLPGKKYHHSGSELMASDAESLAS